MPPCRRTMPRPSSIRGSESDAITRIGSVSQHRQRARCRLQCDGCPNSTASFRLSVVCHVISGLTAFQNCCHSPPPTQATRVDGSVANCPFLPPAPATRPNARSKPVKATPQSQSHKRKANAVSLASLHKYRSLRHALQRAKLDTGKSKKDTQTRNSRTKASSMASQKSRRSASAASAVSDESSCESTTTRHARSPDGVRLFLHF